MIVFNHVTKRYAGEHPALTDCSVTIDGGEFLFVIGPSGAGKTTFLRLLIRDLVPTSGTIVVDNQDIASIAPHELFLLRRKIGTVFQDFKLLMDRTVYENVAVVPEILGTSSRETLRDVMDVLALVGLADKRHYFPLQLSAGEMQRTGIARAIVGGPKVVLADEPTGNLDPQTSWEIMRILKEVNAMGTTVIMATHNAEIVNHLRARTLTLLHGHLVGDEQKGHYRVVGKRTHNGRAPKVSQRT